MKTKKRLRNKLLHSEERKVTHKETIKRRRAIIKALYHEDKNWMYK